MLNQSFTNQVRTNQNKVDGNRLSALGVVLVAFALILVSSACTKVDYIGISYPATTKVDVYFDAEDVEREYKVMGHMVATADDKMVSAEKMQKKIIEKAKEKGADGVIFDDFKRNQTGEKTSYSESSKDKKGKTKTKGSSTTETKFEKEITVTLIKYK